LLVLGRGDMDLNSDSRVLVRPVRQPQAAQIARSEQATRLLMSTLSQPLLCNAFVRSGTAVLPGKMHGDGIS
jgi:hypothetical protein